MQSRVLVASTYSLTFNDSMCDICWDLTYKSHLKWKTCHAAPPGEPYLLNVERLIRLCYNAYDINKAVSMSFYKYK